jgi:hypothetical protein
VFPLKINHLVTKAIWIQLEVPNLYAIASETETYLLKADSECGGVAGL